MLQGKVVMNVILKVILKHFIRENAPYLRKDKMKSL